jgi:hypothetical protein
LNYCMILWLLYFSICSCKNACFRFVLLGSSWLFSRIHFGGSVFVEFEGQWAVPRTVACQAARGSATVSTKQC